MSCPDGLDQMRVSGIRGYGYHGLLASERELGQMFVADVCLGLDLGPAARDGELSYSVDYAELAARVHAVLTGEPCDLIETLCLRMVDLCWDYSQVQWVSVTVHKPEAPITVMFDDVAVTIERSRA